MIKVNELTPYDRGRKVLIHQETKPAREAKLVLWRDDWLLVRRIGEPIAIWVSAYRVSFTNPKETKMENDTINLNDFHNQKPDNNVLLALQLMNGVKLYEVEVYENVYTYKSPDDYAEGDYVILDGKRGIDVVGRIRAKVENPDYSSRNNYRWILMPVEGFAEAQDRFANVDKNMAEKLAKAQAVSAAKALLAEAGIDAENFSMAEMFAKNPAAIASSEE